MGLFLGLDSSTQGLKGMIIDTEAGSVEAECGVNFGRDLPEFNCPNGFIPDNDPLVRHSDPMVWVAALDLLLERMAAAGAPLSRVDGISGSGQQHGTVYLNAKAPGILCSLKCADTLARQLAPALSRKTSPIWMDSSTSAECAEIETAVGKETLRRLTGSTAIERFSGPQIRKFWKAEPDAYAATKRIHLVSSFMASVLVGGDAGIDLGDGSGMNLLDLATKSWSASAANATAPGLLSKLPAAVESKKIVGGLSQYFTKFGLRAQIPVSAWSGDNPCSLVGVGAGEPGAAVISLGTSDTFFAAMTAPKVDPDGCGHVFGNPAGGFMSLICFKNGSLAREKVKDDAKLDWEQFDTLYTETPPGNGGLLVLPYFIPEITPVALTPGLRLKGAASFDSLPPLVRARAIVEAQALSMRIHSKWIGEFDRVRVTGGASKSKSIRKILADVFQIPVETISVPDSAALGAAQMAAHAVEGTSWSAMANSFAAPVETVQPDTSLKKLYDDMADAYTAFERSVNS